MASITFDGSTYNYIIDVLFSETNAPALPEFINDTTPDVDTNIWDKSPFYITYIMRVTNAEKWTLDQVLTGCATIVLTDNTYGLTNIDVWCIRISAIWQGRINHNYPWEITLELVQVQ